MRWYRRARELRGWLFLGLGLFWFAARVTGWVFL